MTDDGRAVQRYNLIRGRTVFLKSGGRQAERMHSLVMRLIVPMATLLLVVLVACGGESKQTPSPTATSAPSPTPSSTVTPAGVVVRERGRLTPEQEACLAEAIGERAASEVSTGQRPPTSDEVDALVDCGIIDPKPDFDLLPEASALAGLGTVAWPNNFQESSALFGRLPSEIAGHRIKARFEQSGLGVFSTTYEEDTETPNKVYMGVTVHDLTKGAFFPKDTNAGQFVALYAQGADWEVLAAGREGDLAWVQWKTGGLYTMHWGNAPSSIVFQAMANDLRLLMALVEAMVSAASE